MRKAKYEFDYDDKVDEMRLKSPRNRHRQYKWDEISHNSRQQWRKRYRESLIDVI